MFENAPVLFFWGSRQYTAPALARDCYLSRNLFVIEDTEAEGKTTVIEVEKWLEIAPAQPDTHTMRDVTERYATAPLENLTLEGAARWVGGIAATPVAAEQ